jgi:hypothetical protein
MAQIGFGATGTDGLWWPRLGKIIREDDLECTFQTLWSVHLREKIACKKVPRDLHKVSFGQVELK